MLLIALDQSFEVTSFGDITTLDQSFEVTSFGYITALFQSYDVTSFVTLLRWIEVLR